jgi:paraquat-inducible protein A
MSRLRWWELAVTARKSARSIASEAEGNERLVPFLITVVGASLVLGLTLPIVSIQKLILFRDEYSILGAIGDLFASGEVFLGLVVLAFSVVFPVAKLVVTDFIWRGCPLEDQGIKRALKLLAWVSRWSMLDVLVVGLLVFSAKASGMANATSQPGLYFFAAAVGGSAAASALLKRAAKRLNAIPPEML